MSTPGVLSKVRVATWNVEARADVGAVGLLLGLRADVLLLTEVHRRYPCPGTA